MTTPNYDAFQAIAEREAHALIAEAGEGFLTISYEMAQRFAFRRCYFRYAGGTCDLCGGTASDCIPRHAEGLRCKARRRILREATT